MDCREFEAKVQDYVEGLGSDRNRRELERHRAGCPHCDELARMQEEIFAALEGSEPATPPPGLEAKILALVSREEEALRLAERAVTAALESTRPVEPPAGLTERIILAVEVQEAVIAGERSRARWWYAGGTALAAAVAAMLIWGLERSSYALVLLYGMAHQGLTDLAHRGETHLARWYELWNEWLATGSAGAERGLTQRLSETILYQVPLPGLEQTLPAYYLAGGAILLLTMWYYYREPAAGPAVRS